MNEGHVRMYRPGAKTQTPFGQGGTIAMTSQWANGTLVSEGSSVSGGGAAAAVKEVYSVSSDGKQLTVDVSVGAPDAKTSTIRYTRISDVGPCESWPTPCKGGR
jgi:hypothetical protein